ncbi:cytochrome bd oxidase subunit II [Actinorhabdospora filicis]|uniref:Cytochrome bd oxidase subunit II n=1 Tax=Actinorhabdospora filicis TaxID=1785913 RepID=A0A9W6WDJ2_9ACTN|nr:cytochrome d ubiquinol oxidase subunit II [Actinorhabdospora filicis]GLZ80900.1 cytochrome bd oxidase subunit II [Actinorhabdospora filicis]
MTGLWYALLGLLFAAYFGLAGLDYGVGMLARHLGRDEREKRLALATVGPFFLGNEVWLVAAIGAMFGAFPLMEGEFLGSRPVLFAVLLCGLVAFTAAVQLRSRGKNVGAFDAVIALGALVTVIGWGAVLGEVLQDDGGLPNWFSLLCGLVLAVLALLHGAAFLAWRGTPELKARAKGVLSAGTLPALIGVALVTVTGIFTVDVAQPIVLIAGAVVIAGAVLLAGRSSRAGLALTGSAAAITLPVLVIGLAKLPYVAGHLTVAQAATGEDALTLLTIAAAPMVPVLLAFQAVTWWLWRRRATPLFY